MSTWKTISAVIIIFALGTIFGFVISDRIPPGGPPPGRPDMILSPPQMHQLFEQDLSEAQKQEISRIVEEVRTGILQEVRGELEEIRRKARPEIEKRRLQALEQIRNILTPEQQEQFDRIIQKNRSPRNRPFRPKRP